MVVFFVVVVVVPQMDTFAFRLFVVPLHFCLEVGMLAGLAVLVSRYGMLMVASLVSGLPGLLLGHRRVLVVLSMCMAVVVAGRRVQVVQCCQGGALDSWRGRPGCHQIATINDGVIHTGLLLCNWRRVGMEGAEGHRAGA